MKTTGVYPRVHVDTADVPAVGQACRVRLIETARAAGLDRTLSVVLERWRRPLAVQDPGKVMLDLAVTVVLGGDPLSDIATLSAEPGVYGRVALDPTVSRTVAMLAADADRALSSIETAPQKARATAWGSGGNDAPDAVSSPRRSNRDRVRCHVADRAQ